MSKLTLTITSTVAVIAVGVGLYLYSPSSTSSTPSVSTEKIAVDTLTTEELSSLVASKVAAFEADGLTLVESDGKYTLTVANEEKARLFILGKLRNVMPQAYASFLDEIEKSAIEASGEFLKGMSFDLDVIKSDTGAKLQVTLRKLTDSVSPMLASKDPKIAQFANLLTKGSISYILSMDKKGDINGIALKDIKENFDVDGTKVSLLMEGIASQFVGDFQKKMDFRNNAKNITFDISSQENIVNIKLQGMKGSMHQEDPLNQVAVSTLEKIAINVQEFRTNYVVNLDKISTSSVSKTADGFLTSGGDMKIKGFSLVQKSGSNVIADLKIGDFNFDVLASHLSTKAILALQQVSMTANADKATQKAMMDLLHEGLSFELKSLGAKSITLKAGPVDKTLNDLDISFKIEIVKNNIDLLKNPMAAIAFIKFHGKIKVNDADLTSLASLAPVAGMVTSMKKVEGDLAVFEFSFANGAITMNGKPLPLPF